MQCLEAIFSGTTNRCPLLVEDRSVGGGCAFRGVGCHKTSTKQTGNLLGLQRVRIRKGQNCSNTYRQTSLTPKINHIMLKKIATIAAVAVAPAMACLSGSCSQNMCSDIPANDVYYLTSFCDAEVACGSFSGDCNEYFMADYKRFGCNSIGNASCTCHTFFHRLQVLKNCCQCPVAKGLTA